MFFFAKFKPFSARFSVFESSCWIEFCTDLVSACVMGDLMRSEKLSLARKLPALFPISQSSCECGCVCENYCSLREAKLSSFEKMYLRLCSGFLTAIMFWFSCEKMQPQQILVSRYQITSSWHSKESSSSPSTTLLACLPPDPAEVWSPNDKWPNESRSGHSSVVRLLLRLLLLLFVAFKW